MVFILSVVLTMVLISPIHGILKKLGWKGILIEPVDTVFEELKKIEVVKISL